MLLKRSVRDTLIGWIKRRLTMSPHQYRGRPASPAGIALAAALALALALPGDGAASVAGSPSGGGCQPAGMEFFTVPPCRVFDSRPGNSLLVGVRLLRVAGLCGIPARARAVSANLTVVNAQVAGYLTAYADDSLLSLTPTINFDAGQVRSNNAVVQLAGDGTGTVTVYFGADDPGDLTHTVDLMLDVNGFFADQKPKSGLAVRGTLPPYSSQFGGNLVTVSGTFPDPASTQVQFGQEAASPAPGSTTRMLVVTAPPFTGTFPTEPCVGLGGVAGTVPLPASVDVTVADAVTGCSITVTGGYSYLPADRRCHVSLPPPVASFVVFTSHATDVANFTDTSTGAPVIWSWDFGDAHTSFLQNPVHDYGAPGSFQVTLTACNAGGCSMASQLVTVPAP
jgi:PKD repeat protein